MFDRRRLKITVTIGTILLASAVGQTHAAAQAATPPSLPATPDPALCQVENPVSVDMLRQLVATPVASPVLETARLEVPATPPAGEPADETMVSAVEATLYEYYACLNSGDFAAIASFFTDDWIRQQFASTGMSMDEADLEFLSASPQALPSQYRVALVGVSDVRRLEDGHIAARVETGLPEPAGGGTREDYVILVEEDGRFLIDGGALGLGGGAMVPGGSTPAA